LSKNNFPILLALLSVFCVAYMDVGQGREQDAEALQQELHNAAMRLLLRLEYEQHCCAISVSYLWTTP
jgi:Na+/H+ antiporter NhaC